MIAKNKRMSKVISLLVKCILFFVVFSVASSPSFSIPVPMGIDGYVYGLDGVTRGDEKVKFSVYNLDSGYYVEGTLRKNGFYSATISGRNGDTILVRAWTPYNSAEQQTILSGVMHGFNIILNLSNPDLGLRFTTDPITSVLEDSLYEYQCEAHQEGNGDITYSLVQSPEGMYFNADFCYLSWIPMQNDVGNHSISIRAYSDDFFVEQSFLLEVISVDDTPRIISEPLTLGAEGSTYTYTVEAYDEDSDLLFYTLVMAPEGMEIGSGGNISWTPGVGQAGNYNITVRVSDGNTYSEQSYVLTVIELLNNPPVITSSPITSIHKGTFYLYQVEAYDENSDLLFYTLLMAPEGMKINLSTGLLEWDASHIGIYNVTIKVSDIFGAYALQEFQLEVTDVNQPPIIISDPITEAEVFQVYIYDVKAIDPENDRIRYSLSEKPPFMFVNYFRGRIYWVPVQPGIFPVVVRASDPFGYSEQKFNVTVRPFRIPLSKSKNIQKGIKTSSEIIQMDYPWTKSEIYKIIPLEQSSVEKLPLNMVYQYFSVEKKSIPDEYNPVIEQPEEMSFIVSKPWVESISLKERVKLEYYEPNSRKWLEKPIRFTEEDDNYYYFESYLSAAGVYAITASAIPEKLQKKMNQRFNEKEHAQLKKPFVITGLVAYNTTEPVQGDAEYRLTNLNTGEEIFGIIRGDFKAYADTVYGSAGDKIKIEIKTKDMAIEHYTDLDSDMVREDIILQMPKDTTAVSLFEFISWLVLLGTPFALIIGIARLYFMRK